MSNIIYNLQDYKKIVEFINFLFRYNPGVVFAIT